MKEASWQFLVIGKDVADMEMEKQGFLARQLNEGFRELLELRLQDW